MIVGIIAVDEAGVIGNNGKMPWYNIEDLHFFKKQTIDRTIVMGRKTWESLGSKPLPRRTNVVVSKDKNFEAKGAYVINSVDEIRDLSGEHIFIIGGMGLMNSCKNIMHNLIITKIEGEHEGDLFFNEKILSNFYYINTVKYNDLTIEIHSKSKMFIDLK